MLGRLCLLRVTSTLCLHWSTSGACGMRSTNPSSLNNLSSSIPSKCQSHLSCVASLFFYWKCTFHLPHSFILNSLPISFSLIFPTVALSILTSAFLYSPFILRSHSPVLYSCPCKHTVKKKCTSCVIKRSKSYQQIMVLILPLYFTVMDLMRKLLLSDCAGGIKITGHKELRDIFFCIHNEGQ